jgi:hypothetical protein
MVSVLHDILSRGKATANERFLDKKIEIEIEFR